MSRATERLSELKNKGLITQEQYDELLAALSTVENELPQVPQAPRLPAEPAVPTAPIRPVTPVSAPQAVGHLSVRLISEDLHVRGVQGLPAVRVVGGQSGIRTRQNGDVVEIESRLTAGEFHGFSFSLGFGSDGQPVELEVPADMACELKTVSGDITLSNLKGETVVRSVSADILSFSGDVSLEGVTIQSGARLKTTSGDVRAELDQHDVMVDVETRSGEASVRGPGVDVEVQRQRIPVGLATVELSVHTGSGDIEVRLT